MWTEGRGRRKTNREIRREKARAWVGGGGREKVKTEGNYSGSQPDCISQQAEGENGGSA